MQIHKSQEEKSLQDFEVTNTQEMEELENCHQQHFSESQLIEPCIGHEGKRMVARVKRIKEHVNKSMELSKQIHEVMKCRQDVSLQHMKHSVDTQRGTLDQFQGRTEKWRDHVELCLEQECDLCQ
jgi:hypothetical protein